LARWLTGWAAASAMEPPFLPRNPHISSHPSRNPTDNGKPQVLLFLFFFFYRLSFGCLVWFGWLVGWLPAWLADGGLKIFSVAASASRRSYFISGH